MAAKSCQKILAVDDEIHMLKLLERIISEKTDYIITTTSNAFEVPDLLENNKYDLLITDLKMPGFSGLDLLKQVKEQGRQEEVIIITAFGSSDTALDALTLGVFDYITKPFRKEQIIASVERVMRYQSAKREADILANIIDRQPYSEAEKAFRLEFLRRLNERCPGDLAEMSALSGLNENIIKNLLSDNDGQKTV